MSSEEIHLQMHQEISQRLGSLESTQGEIKSELRTQTAKVQGAIWMAGCIFAVLQFGASFFR